MGAPIIIGNSYDLWVSNSMKDTFCEVLTAVAALEGHDITAIYEEAPGVAGTYGVSGIGIHLDEFHHYLGGRAGVRHHLDLCCTRLDEVAESCGLSPAGSERMAHLLAWAAHHMDGHPIPEGCNLYEHWPPGSTDMR
ncbi:hypothetical protein HX867_25070 [Pseudomonas gingeri]|uniref:hypothetical protein n=1 Tax=Pseudomonas gingeri TaxID=117681 RepID=UPI0015A326D0|nr:hypothetical protein [Pseudomonas gingeri]NVZ65379.1 hypothetical protein [Pseudomonas gingeri]NVZ77630.1 hypothetical protein [Pseudomonas gingeri]